MVREPLTPWLEGVGLHSGLPCRARLLAGDEGAGVVFQTVRGEIPARADFLDGDATRTTRLVSGSASVGMIEHLMAALSTLGATDLIVQVEGPELPVLDGSAREWAASLHTVETGAIRFWSISSPVEVSLGDSRARLEPPPPGELPEYRVDIDFDSPAIGRQSCVYRPLSASFETELAPARTFTVLDEISALRRRGLARGGSLDNALVIGEDGPLNPDGLRFKDEPVRHKLLDAMGDLMLLGGLPWARVELVRPGHRLLHEVVRRVPPGSFHDMERAQPMSGGD